MARKNNTEHHLDYVISLCGWLTLNKPSNKKWDGKMSKLVYCINKLQYNVSVKRTTKEHIQARLKEGIKDFPKQEWLHAILPKASQIAKDNKTYIDDELCSS